MHPCSETRDGVMASGIDPGPWVPWTGTGTYRNPVIFADYADLDVVGVDGDFYLTASSFHCTPGLPILHSRDLVHWRIIGHALRNLPDPRYGRMQPGSGVWAPSIRHHGGRFWIYFATPDEGVFLVQAERPEGPWSDPVCVLPGKGIIDPCPLWDDDGRAYLVHAYAKSRSGIKHRLAIRALSWDGLRVGRDETIIADGEDRFPTIEGPKFLKRDGWYYLFAPVGGVTAGWQSVLRSRAVLGPYEYRVVMAQGRTPINGPHQGAVLCDRLGAWWFMHFQDRGVYGRVSHLQPMSWGADGWPRIGVAQDHHGVGEPVLEHPLPATCAGQAPAVPQTGDDFRSRDLGLSWQWNANHEAGWADLRGDGRLRLLARSRQAEPLDRHPGILTQKFPAPGFAVEVGLVGGQGNGLRAGLLVLGERSAGLLAVHGDDGAWSIRRWEDGEESVLAPLTGARVRIRLEVQPGGQCTFRWRPPEEMTWRTAAPGFQALPGIWIGARFGLVAEGSGGYGEFSAVTVAALPGGAP